MYKRQLWKCEDNRKSQERKKHQADPVCKGVCFREDVYKRQDCYHPGDEGGLAWNDPEIGVEWPLEEGCLLYTSKL